MIRELRTVTVALLVGSSLHAQFRPAVNRSAPVPVREIGAVFIGMTSCCEALTDSLRGPIDSVRQIFRLRASRDGTLFRMIGVSLDWKTEEGWKYLRQFGEFDEIGVGSNWFGMLPEVLMFTTRQVDPVVPQLVIYERLVSRGEPQPTFGPRTILKQLHGSREIAAWVRAGAQLP